MSDICNGIHPDTDLNYISINSRGDLGLYLVAGDGTLVDLSWEVPHGGNFVLSRRKKALALALLDLARQNIESSVES